MEPSMDPIETPTCNGHPLLANTRAAPDGKTWVDADEKGDGKFSSKAREEAVFDKVDKGPPKWRSQRYILAYFAFVGIMNIFLQRVNLSIAIVCMVNHTAISSNKYVALPGNNQSEDSLHSALLNNQSEDNGHQNLNFSESNFYELSTLAYGLSAQRLSVAGVVSDGTGSNLSYNHLLPLSTTDVNGAAEGGGGDGGGGENVERLSSCAAMQLSVAKKEDGPFAWTKQEQGLLLGAVYWTYAMSSVPANNLLRNVRRKTVIIVSMTTMTAMTMLIHAAALWSPWAVFVLKLVQGVATAVAVIGFYSVWAAWAPPRERAGLISYSTSGQMFATVIVFPISGALCKYGPLGGWPSIFYVFGLISLVWLVLFALFTEDSPTTSRFITEGERNYILSSLDHTMGQKKAAVKTPWRAILTSPAMWAVVSGQVSFAFGYFLLLSTLPQYMNEVLMMDINSNGVFSSLPYIAIFIANYTAGNVSDWAVKRGLLRVIWARRVCVLIANLVPAVCLTAMSYMDCNDSGLAIALLTIGVGASGFALSGFLITPYDVAPRFAADMLSFSNSLATVTGVITPYAVAAITKDKSREQWQIVFFLTSAILVVGALGYCLLTRGSIQEWAKVKSASRTGSVTMFRGEVLVKDPGSILEEEAESEEVNS